MKEIKKKSKFFYISIQYVIKIVVIFVENITKQFFRRNKRHSATQGCDTIKSKREGQRFLSLCKPLKNKIKKVLTIKNKKT